MTDKMLAQTLVQLSATLAGNADAMDFLDALVSGATGLLAAEVAGVVLADGKGELRVVAASDEQGDPDHRTGPGKQGGLQSLLGLQTREGPGFDAHRSEEIVSADLTASVPRWPVFAPAALALGYRSVCALPLKARETTLGALTLLRTSEVPLDANQVLLGEALAGVATIGLLQQRAVRQAELLAEQLQQALDSRVLLEQAKGVLAERLDVPITEAFSVLRRAARNSNTRLSDYARLVIEGPRGPTDQKWPGSSPS